MRAASAVPPSAQRYNLRSPAQVRRQGPRPMLVKILIVVILLFVLYNLGAGLYYMMTDKGTTDRTVKALTWRIGLSVFLILLVILGIWTGVIQPHGIGR
jgi:succinate dehydrogenase/fumarate reductase cytochrome b subunit